MLALDDIRLGDVVRLRNGETITVRSLSTSYTDSDGEHEGPFIMAKGTFDHYLLSDIGEVVKKNERVCACGHGITASDPDTDFCEFCFYAGVPFERAHLDLFTAIRALPNVTDANVWHTGGGCFLFAVRLNDGRLVTLTEDGYIPDPGDPWDLIVVSPDGQAWDDWDEARLDLRNGKWDDEQLAAEVAAISRSLRLT